MLEVYVDQCKSWYFKGSVTHPLFFKGAHMGLLLFTDTWPQLIQRVSIRLPAVTHRKHSCCKLECWDHRKHLVGTDRRKILAGESNVLALWPPSKQYENREASQNVPLKGQLNTWAGHFLDFSPLTLNYWLNLWAWETNHYESDFSISQRNHNSAVKVSTNIYTRSCFRMTVHCSHKLETLFNFRT